MKKFIIIFLFILLPVFTGSIFAEYTAKYLQKACSSYTTSLKSDENCLVTSALINVMRMYYKHPDHNFNPIKEQLETLISEGRTGQIRYLSEIAKRYLSEEADYDWLMNRGGEEIYIYLILDYERFAKEKRISN